MNKELEEFKKNMLIELKSALNPLSLQITSDRICELIKTLTPKPEFIMGEIVEYWDNRYSPRIGRFESAWADTSSNEIEYECNKETWDNCKKLEALPMHMTEHDGSEKYPENVEHETLVYVLLNNGTYSGGIISDFNWRSVAKYQILKDLEGAE